MLAVRLILAALLLASCGLPRDPEGTLERVTGGRLRVGVAEHPPWTSVSAEPSGVEVDLVEAFAGELDADVEWIDGATPALLAAVEQNELDLVIGGLTSDDPWGGRVTLTQPYIRVRTVLGVAPGAVAPEDLEDVRVSVERGSETVFLLESAGAVPVEVSDLSSAEPPVAAPEWEIRRLGLQPTELVLEESGHVMAVPHGENAWLVRLERFLHSQVGEIPSLLEEHTS